MINKFINLQLYVKIEHIFILERSATNILKVYIRGDEMSYKIRQLPNLLISSSCYSRFQSLTLPSDVKVKLRRFLLRLSLLGEDYVEELLEDGRLVVRKDEFIIFQDLHESRFYSLLLQGNRILTLYIKDEQELSVEDWEDGQFILMQEDWE